MLLALVISVTLCTVWSSWAQKPWEPDRFPIACWRGPPPSHNTLENYRILRECGFNVVGPTGGYNTAEGNRKMLDLCARAGLKAIIVDPRLSPHTVLCDDWRSVVARSVKDYADHPALYGYHLKDEPNSLLFDPLGKISREIERVDPAHLPYINLFPTYASTRQLGTPDYKDYLARFRRITTPRLLSYDHYALLKGGGIRPDYYENMELVRAESLRSGIPWWYVHYSGAYSGYRPPTEAEMRWQVYTSLAYGVKGISYWYYWGRRQKNDERTGVVDPDGKPTRLYWILRKLNRETQILGDVLLRATSTEVAHTGDIPPGCRRLGTDSIVRLPPDKPLMVGLFRTETGQRYAMIVNRDPANPVQFTAQFAPHITRVERISAEDGGATESILKDRALDLTLAPGGGVLLRLTTHFDYPRPPEELTTIDFRFDADNDLEGWGGFSGLSNARVAHGTLTMEVGPNDPHFQRDYLRVPPGTYKALRVRMRITSGAPTAQVFWTTSEEPVYTDTKYMNFDIVPDGAWHEYEIPVHRHPRWAGKEIRGIRLDPTTGGSKPGTIVEIDWIVGVPAAPK